MATANIRDLIIDEEDQLLDAKVYRKWVSKSLSDFRDQSFCCILIDSQGDAIQATMDLCNTTYFDQKLAFGSVYRISQFICEATKPYQQTLANNKSLKFGKMASFMPLPGKENQFPDHHFEFVSHNQLFSRVPYRDNVTRKMVYPILTDFLGCIRSISDIIPSGDVNTGQKFRRKVGIESLDGSIIELAMWDNLAREFVKEKIEKDPFPIILAITACRVTKYRDTELQLSATSATHFYINPRIQEARDAYALFKTKYSDNPPLQVVSQRYTDIEQEKWRNRQTLDCLLQQNPSSFKYVRFTCEAVITAFNPNRGWHYASCSECRKPSKFQKKRRTYYCADHGTQDPVTYRYNFSATVADGTTSAEFTFFTEAGEKLTRKRCNVLRQLATALGYNQLPTQMVNQIGQAHIFQIQFTESSQQGSGRFVVNDILDIQQIPEEELNTADLSATTNQESPQKQVHVGSTSGAITSDTQQESQSLLDYTPGTPPEDVIETVASSMLDTLKKDIPGQTIGAKRSLAKELSAAPKKQKDN